MNNNFINKYSYQDSLPLYIVVILTAPVKINKQEVLALIDLRAEISIILLDLIKKLKLLISYTFIIIIVNIIRASKQFIGLYKDISININRIIYKITIQIIYRLKYSLVLRQPFYKQAQLKLREMYSKKTEVTIYILNSIRIVSQITIQSYKERD